MKWSNAKGVKRMLSVHGRKPAAVVVEPVAKGLLGIGLTPNLTTLIGTFATMIAMVVLIPTGHLVAAAVRQLGRSGVAEPSSDPSAAAPVHWTRRGRSEVGAPARARAARTSGGPRSGRSAGAARVPGVYR